jgi:hypothetical protein
MRERELGSTRVEVKGGGGSWVLPYEDYAEVSRAFVKGEAFYEGKTLYGGTVTIRLGDVSGIIQNAPETMAAVRADRIADQHEDDVGVAT